MPNYSAPWEALLNDTPQHVDTTRNPDVDAAMGFNELPTDDTGTRFAKGLASAMYRNSPEGREVTTATVKAKLANQLQLQLMQQKYELAKQYPEYTHFAPNGLGGVIGVTPYGDTKQVVPNIPGMEALVPAENAAKLNKAQMEARPEYTQAIMDEQQAKVGLTKAQTSEALAMPALRQKMAEKDQAYVDYLKAREGNIGQPKPKYETLSDAQKQAAFELTGYYPGDKNYGRAIRDDPSLPAKINDRANTLFNQQNVGKTGGANPMPDINSIMSSPF